MRFLFLGVLLCACSYTHLRQGDLRVDIFSVGRTQLSCAADRPCSVTTATVGEYTTGLLTAIVAPVLGVLRLFLPGWLSPVDPPDVAPTEGPSGLEFPVRRYERIDTRTSRWDGSR